VELENLRITYDKQDEKIQKENFVTISITVKQFQAEGII